MTRTEPPACNRPSSAAISPGDRGWSKPSTRSWTGPRDIVLPYALDAVSMVPATVPRRHHPNGMNRACGIGARVESMQEHAGRRTTMVALEGGEFVMGSADPLAYPGDGEGPVRRVRLDPFGIDAHAVSNAAFAEFAAATGHVTEAERFGWSFGFGGLLPDDFPPTRAVAAAQWWRQVEDACWRQPEGPGSDLADRMD